MNADDYTALLTEPQEVVIEKKTGRARQAGASQSEGAAITGLKRKFERSLYAFAKGVLARDRLTVNLHKPVCDWFMATPPYRKGLLLPRDHLKSSIVAQALPIHMHLQPREANVYFAGRDGVDIRILLACETETRASAHVRWVETQYESNQILRAFWPHRCWDAPLKQSKKWSERQMLLPRTTDFADVSLQAIGVGGAITGAHFDVLLKDDLISIEAANSQVVMETAIEWHRASRALMDDPDKSLEFIIGTRWAVHDLYEEIQRTDPSVEWMRRAVVEDGRPIFPELFSLATVERLQKELGPLFWLLYMNEAAAHDLTDFDIADVRSYEQVGDRVVFMEDGRDVHLAEVMHAPAPTPDLPRGTKLTKDVWDTLLGREEFFRLRYGV